MLKIFLFLFFLVHIVIVTGQYSVNGGISTLKAFGDSKPYIGFHLGGEFPRDNETSFYLKAGFYSKNKLNPEIYGSAVLPLQNIDPNDYTYRTVSGESYFNYTTFDGGLRYYLLEGYDSGFALYGGSNVMGVINKAKVKLDDYDKTKYRLESGTSLSGSLLNLGVGFNGGAKYTFAGIGSIYADATFDYLLIGIPSNETAKTIASNFYSPIIFSFNIGFRKDFY